MITNICKILSQDPDDIAVYINDIVLQQIERTDPSFVTDSESFCDVFRIFKIHPRKLFNSASFARQFLSVKIPTIPQRKASSQPFRKRQIDMKLMPSEEIMDVFEAGRKGRYDVLQEMVRTRGLDVLNQRDDSGHTVGHWAALEGHVSVISYLISVGGPYDAVTSHSLKQRPIHWACANGFIRVIETLLQANVDINVTDANSCTPLIVSCQYGQTSAAAFLMARGAHLQECDTDGDNALHWAAFRGRPELVRLLVYSGFNPHQRDNHGQSPLHLACISGNLSIVRDLCHIDRVNFENTDTKGRTPLALARGRRHDDVCEFLKRENEKLKGSLLTTIDLKSIIFGPPGRKRQPQIGFVVITVFIMYPVFFFKILPTIWGVCPTSILLFFIFNFIGGVSFLKASFLNPGFVPRYQPEYDVIMRQIGSPQESGLDLAQLCHTCRAVKPLRAKHCRVCDRCVMHMDHHCPYIYNCVGFNNRGWFFCFIYSVLIVSILSFYFSYLLLSQGFDLALLLVLPIGFFGFAVVGAVGSCLWFSVLHNITTNELSNWKRYAHLKNSQNVFRNPFNHGFVSNIMEYFHLRSPKDQTPERTPLIL